MKDITLFMFDSCPHCRLALRCLAELQQQDKYKDIRIRQVDEKKEPELADQYDYWYVPTFYVGDEKVHEGHAELEDVRKVLDLALEG